MTKIKICGLMSLEDVDIVNKYEPDYIGFVFAPSKRKVTEKLALEMRKRLKTSIQSVGVFVNAPISQILSLEKHHVIDIIQLHGDETEKEIKELQENTKLPIIRAMRIKNQQQVLKASEMKVDYLLCDTFVKGQYGGSGTTFDWSLVPKVTKPIFIAGGITLSNVRDVINQTQPYCIDISSGVETEGRKDEVKIKKIIEAVREMNIGKR